MPEILIGIHIAGTNVDTADLLAFLNSTKKLDYPALMTLLHKMAKITVTNVSQKTITVTPKKPTAVTTWTEKQLYPPP